MNHYPLLFGYRDLVAGKGFVAGVEMDGRALLVDEDEGSWFCGVNPGGLAAGGTDHGSAALAFRHSYRSVLFDLAAEAATFEDFRQAVEAFFAETNEPTREEWEEAVLAVRDEQVDLTWLIKRPADLPRSAKVTNVGEQPVSSFNRLDEEALADRRRVA